MQAKWGDFVDLDGDGRIDFWIRMQKRWAGGKLRGRHVTRYLLIYLLLVTRFSLILPPLPIENPKSKINNPFSLDKLENVF